MKLKTAALKLGLQMVQAKLGQAMGDPGFDVLQQQQAQPDVRLPTTPRQIKDRSAKVQPPRVVTTR